MSKTVLIATRDASGLSDFSKELKKEFGFRLLAVDSIADDSFSADGSVDFATALELIKASDVSIVVANFLDVASVGREFMSWKRAMEAFDHGVTDLIRAAARRLDSVVVLGDPKLYPETIRLLREGGGTLPREFRIDQACNGLHAVAEFDAAVAQYLEMQAGDAPDIDALSGYPKSIRYAWKRGQSLPEGVTARQKAALYGTFHDHFERVAGPDLDYMSLLDVSLAVDVIGEFEKTTAVIVQRGNFVSAATGDEIADTVSEARRTFEPLLSGATLVVNGSVDEKLLTELKGGAFATVIAPGFSNADEAGELRLLESREGLGYESLHEIRTVIGGVLVQDKNRIAVNPLSWRMPCAIQPLVSQWEDMIFAVKLTRHFQSSTCIAVKDGRVVSRASAMVRQGNAWGRLEQYGESLDGVVLAFDEDIEDPVEIRKAKEAGVSVVLHPGNDADQEPHLAAIANEVGIALVATGVSFRKR